MAKSWDYRGNRKKGSFGQKKRELLEIEDLAVDGYLDEISNSKRFSKKAYNLEEQYENNGKFNKESKRRKNVRLEGIYRFSTIPIRY